MNTTLVAPVTVFVPSSLLVFEWPFRIHFA